MRDVTLSYWVGTVLKQLRGLALQSLSKAGSLVVFIGLQVIVATELDNLYARMPPSPPPSLSACARERATKRNAMQTRNAQNNMLIILLLFPIWKVLHFNREWWWERNSGTHTHSLQPNAKKNYIQARSIRRVVPPLMLWFHFNLVEIYLSGNWMAATVEWNGGGADS